ncbi:Crp/Fnr family transcriptional regulator [Clostridium botulinum C]|uniref:Crp/Fnr family transcriptional regulator n=2 Tax=Clostridium botulinum TaxID=1491 RepID=A0A9Q4TMR1_CLOBO|nr:MULTISPECIES: Crp/Fnr family transcriptional regulator [Clostridium]EGO88246.1 transcriptional regulator [Clostridium botulinum C str. Stockholm]AYF54586.1 Crp/Fnr family transcriptional regulator [Clostridium novyi]MCD3194573.1 Crp/Fnr family transcriptional regulator [Clostridium botulinum C]MCD3199727.1 Crp/Fnr family transcriptional regulator [Clostridium botulinum C]MCD3205202.1 Crp/Fnr family transcriptional regulator [Clostridium botulinum C]
MIEKYIETIKECSLFHSIKEEEIICMLKCLTPQIHTFNKNECIVNSGETIDKFGIILEGEATILKENSEGNRIIISVIKKGDLFGEMLVFSSRKIWPVTVRVQNSCKVLFLTNSDLIARCSKMCPWHNSLLQNFIKIISDKSLILNKKVEYLSIKSIRGKISTYLLEQYQNNPTTNIFVPLNRNELADFLNVSRPSLSREICGMRDEGIIDFHLSTFRIKDINALKSFCK